MKSTNELIQHQIQKHIFMMATAAAARSRLAAGTHFSATCALSRRLLPLCSLLALQN